MTTGSTRAYLFGDHALSEEVQRLQVIENAYDLYSQARLLRSGIGPGARCLEVGVGAGSMARWMAEQAGPEGTTFAVDINDKFFPLLSGTGVELINDDIRNVDFEEGSLDFIHARLLFMHLPDRAAVLDRFVRWLRPGGWIVIVDADMGLESRVAGELGALWIELSRRFVRAIDALGGDAAIGRKVDRLFLNAGLTNVEASYAFHQVVPGGPEGRFLEVNMDAIRRLADVSDLRSEDLDTLRQSLPSGEYVQTSYAVVVTSGQRLTA